MKCPKLNEEMDNNISNEKNIEVSKIYEILYRYKMSKNKLLAWAIKFRLCVVYTHDKKY